MVVVGRRRSALPDLHRDGQDRSRRAEASRSNRCCSCPPRRRGSGSSGRSPCSTPTTRRTGTWRSISPTCACPRPNVLKGEGCGFEIAQGRLGPGQHPPLHAPRRPRGARARADGEATVRPCRLRQPRSRAQTVWQERIAESRCMIEQARLLVLKAAYLMDTVGNKVAKKEIAMIKVVAPNVACKVIDWAIQAYGAAGVHDEFLVGAYASARELASRRRPRRSPSERDREARVARGRERGRRAPASLRPRAPEDDGQGSRRGPHRNACNRHEGRTTRSTTSSSAPVPAGCVLAARLSEDPAVSRLPPRGRRVRSQPR